MKLTSTSEVCPYCKVSLIHSEISKDSRQFYLPMVKVDDGTKYGRYEPVEDDGRPLYFYRTMGVYNMDVDRTVGYRCPDCGAFDER